MTSLGRWMTREGSRRYLLSFLPALAVLIVIVAAVPYVWLQPDDGMDINLPSFQVYGIAPDGPAERAGMQTGDYIAQVNGIPFSQKPSLYGQKKAGDTVALSVLRGDQVVSLSLVLAAPSPSTTLERLEPLFIALSFWGIAVVALALKPAAREMQLFYLFCLIGAGVLAVGELTTFNLVVASRGFGVLMAWLSPITLHFHALFPQRKAFFLRRRNLGLFYGLGLALSLPSLLWPGRLMDAFWYPWLRDILRAVLALSILVSIGLLLHAYRTTREPRIRRRVRLIVLGTTWAFAPLAFLCLLPDALTGLPLIAYETGFLPLPFIPLSYAVAIYKHNLLDIDRFLNHSLVHLILGAFWVGLYLLLAAVLNVLFPATMLARPLIGALVTLFMATTLISLRRRTQRWIDRLFYGGWYDYRSVVAGVSASLSEARDEVALVEQLVHQVAATMKLQGAALFLTDRQGRLTLRDSAGFECPLRRGMPLSLDCSLASDCSLGPGTPILADSPLARLLCQESKALENSDLQQRLAGVSLPDAERAWLATGHVQLWTPLVFKGELRGLFLLGSKEGDDFFDVEDRRILETLAHQAALTAENVRLLDSLRRRVEELTLLRGELEATHRQLLTSREEERKRLARNLHDQSLQTLFALNIGLQATTGMVGDDPVVEQLIAVRQDVVRLADGVRRLCAELRPPALSIMGLADAIRSYTEKLAARRGNIHVVGGFSNAPREASQSDLTITLDLAQDRKRLDDQIAIALFRVYQEALLNVEKHARADNVWVQEQLEESRVELNIRDDGRGFVTPSHLGRFVRQGHFGLLGSQEQMAAVGGGLQVASQPGEGTEILAWAPINGKEER